MAHIVLVGAGNIGSRHLQALARMERSVSISVIDPFPASLTTAEQRWNEALQKSAFKGKSSFASSMDTLPATVDLAIIATDSANRKASFDQLTSLTSVKNAVFEKFLFQKPEDYGEVARTLETQGINAWVNCPRRMMPVYQQIKALVADENRIDFVMKGTDWGMACNSIHMADLFAFLTRDASIEFSGERIDPEVLEAKRKGYIELLGTISGSDERGNTLSVTSTREKMDGNHIEITTPDFSIKVHENGNASAAAIASKKSGRVETIPFAMPYQSELSHLFAEPILSTGSCQLTGFAASAALHLGLLAIFIPHLEKHKGITNGICPIT